MLFASSDGSSFLSLVLVFGFFFFGLTRAVKKISGSPTGRTVVTKGAGYLIKQLFK